jgi:hypothetical protein
VHTNSFRAVRGSSILCAVLDEVAFFRHENFASLDTEVDAAISPGLARLPGSMKILISSVHKRSGLLYQHYRDYYGKDNDDVLVVYGTTLQFNPSFDESIIEKALAEDPERYGTEYLSKWRDVVAEIVALMRQYRCGKIVGDKYGAQWTVEAFARAGTRYEPSELDRSAIYMNCYIHFGPCAAATERRGTSTPMSQIYAAAAVASFQHRCAAVRNRRRVGRLIKCR